ncbi:MAG TPA: PilZ domain-containing protein [Candidatus Brocadiaceae bacterium]|nr:PilZ domain-containing protein [Candidatus Brocadiaceae bacterium]
MDNKRLFRRIPFDTQTRVICNNVTYNGTLLDISLKGALIQFIEPIPAVKGECYNIAIHLPSSNVNMFFEATLVHVSQVNYGFKFLTENIDTITHLRRLMELNIGDDKAVVEELAYWLQA